MSKIKRPAPRPPHQAAPDADEALPQSLAELAQRVLEHEQHEEQLALHKLVRKLLLQKNDEALYDAIERARELDVAAYQFLRAQVEEASSTLLVRRDGAPEMEINAFVVPLFVRSSGGLQGGDSFHDQQAFEQLVASFQQGALESLEAKVVLINHAYDLHEIDRITYCQLAAMVRDAYAAISERKIVPTPALDASMPGWADTAFGLDDSAVELRFLLGFALKRSDDPFYRVPDDELLADAYFDARMQRYQAWTALAAPLLRRCLAAQPDGLEINFLYQDLFHGGKEQGMAEYFMLQMMADVNHALREHKLEAGAVRAIVAPTDVYDNMVLRVNLYALDSGALLASSDKPLDLAVDMRAEVDDIADALAMVGIDQVAVALRFDRQGKAIEPKPYQGPA